MWKRRLLCAGVILLFVMAAVWKPLRLWPFNDLITQANCDRIVPGSSRADVEAILGGRNWTFHCGVGIPPGEDPEFWDGQEGVIQVDFDYDGRVIRARYAPHSGHGHNSYWAQIEHVWDYLLQRLGW